VIALNDNNSYVEMIVIIVFNVLYGFTNAVEFFTIRQDLEYLTIKCKLN